MRTKFKLWEIWTNSEYIDATREAVQARLELAEQYHSALKIGVPNIGINPYRYSRIIDICKLLLAKYDVVPRTPREFAIFIDEHIPPADVSARGSTG